MDKKMEIDVPNGVIVIYKNVDIGAPGCTVMFRPNGTDDEIDLVCIESKVEKSYWDNDVESEKDLCLYVYGDPYTDDFTDKHIIKANDVTAALDI